MFTTATTPPALRAYRERHVITPVRDYGEEWGGYREVCEHDGIRVYARQGGYVHDPSEIKDLAARERGEAIRW